MPAIPWWLIISTAADVGSQVYSGFQQGKAAKSAGKRADAASDRADAQLARTDTAISDLRTGFGNVSAGQTEFMDRLREQMRTGALPVGQLTSQVSQRVNEQGNIAEQRVRGESFSRGFGGSAAAASAVGRVQSASLQTIAEQSRAIGIQNELSKEDASNKLGQIGLGETAANRQMEIAALNATIGAGSQLNQDLNIVDANRNAIDQQIAGANSQIASGIAGGVGAVSNYATAPRIEFEGKNYRWFNGQWIEG